MSDLSLVQGSQEWLDMRKRFIGASDAPIIMNVSPWKKRFDLWEEKIGVQGPQETNQWMRRGVELEPIARQAYCDHLGIQAEAQVVFHPQIDWMMASLDGLSCDGSIAVEIKCPGEKDHSIAISGKIPEKYYPQLQHQLAVLGHAMIHYFSYRDGKFALVEVERDDEYIERLLEEEKSFWNCVQNFVPPDDQKVLIVKDDAQWKELASDWREINRKISELKIEEGRCREKLIGLSEDRSCVGYGVTVKKIYRKGSINYKKIPEIKNINLDKYRGPNGEYWKISSHNEVK